MWHHLLNYGREVEKLRSSHSWGICTLQLQLFQFLNKSQSFSVKYVAETCQFLCPFLKFPLVELNLAYQKIPKAFLPSHPNLLPPGTAARSTLAWAEPAGWTPTASDGLSWLELNKSEGELVNLHLNTGYKQWLRVKWNYLRQMGVLGHVLSRCSSF